LPLALLALGAALPAPAAEEYVIDPAHTFATWEVDHLGIATQRGRFDRSRGKATLDRDARAGTIEVEIDAGSASTGNPALDKLLASDEFFDASRNPVIAFRAQHIEFAGGDPARVEGELTLAGVSRPLTLAIARFACTRKPFVVVQRCGADATATLRRSHFGMSRYASFVGDEVRISVQVEAILQEQPPPAGATGG
jgi:polyisoprenoid-binding protein YceI